MGHQHDKVDMLALVCAELAADRLIALLIVQHVAAEDVRHDPLEKAPRDQPDQQHADAADLLYEAGREELVGDAFRLQIGADHRRGQTVAEDHQMRQTVVQLVVAERDRVRADLVDELDGVFSLVIRTPDVFLQDVAADAEERGAAAADLFHIARQQRDAALLDKVNADGKVQAAVQIVGMQDRDFFFHGRSPAIKSVGIWFILARFTGKVHSFFAVLIRGEKDIPGTPRDPGNGVIKRTVTRRALRQVDEAVFRQARSREDNRRPLFADPCRRVNRSRTDRRAS